jgi:hypothetical protein
MIVEYKIYVVGRGWIICTKYDGKPLRVGDRFSIDNNIFEIRGIEAFRYNIGSPIGLLLRPNGLVESIKIGSEIKK